MIKAICFDLDGTLVSFRGNYAAGMARLGVAERLEEFMRQYNIELRVERAQSFLDVLQHTFRALSWEPPPNLPQIAEESYRAYIAGIELLPGALETVQYFAHLPKAIITNGPSDMQWGAIRKVGLEPYFQTILVSGDPDVAVRKPNPRIFQMACERLGVEPGEVLMIGDNLEQDIQGARALGMQAVHRP